MSFVTSESAALAGLEETFVGLLRQVSLATPLPMLSARERWQHVTELLLGHAQVRGGRTRDFPFSPQREASALICQALLQHQNRFRPGQSALEGAYSAYDLVVCLQIIEVSSMDGRDPTLESERHFSSALWVLLDELFPSEWLPRLATTLGIAEEGVEISHRWLKQYRREELLLARTMATLARTDPCGRSGDALKASLLRAYLLRPRQIERLETLRVSLIYLKTRKVQPFLDQCRRSFIQRGASYWCSQITSRVRDIILAEQGGRVSLLIDCDSVTVMVAPASMPCIRWAEQLAQGFFLDPDDRTQLNPGVVERFWPRLQPYYHQARQEGVATAGVLPTLGFDLRPEMSLWTLICQRILASAGHDNRSPSAIDWLAVQPSSDSSEVRVAPQTALDVCYGHVGQPRFTREEFAMPLWYNPSGEQSYGWASTVFSLSGLAFNRLTLEALEQLFQERGLSGLRCARTQRELMQALPGAEPEISLLKLDGDGIGKAFSALSLICRPALSASLENAMRRTWLDSLISLIREHHLTTTPIDLIYAGGDDLLIALPSQLSGDFLRAFGLNWERNAGNSALKTVTFTYAEIVERPQYTRTADNEDSGRSLREVNRLLDEAKELYREKRGSSAGKCSMPCGLTRKAQSL